MSKKTDLTGVITGDLIASRTMPSAQWLPVLKDALSVAGNTPYMWDIFRGDSFQLEVRDPGALFFTVLQLKVAMKSLKGVDVRMAMAIGPVTRRARRIAESEGEVFIFSGALLEALKKEKSTLAIRSPWPEFDRDMNVCLRLAAILMDGWSTASAELVALLLREPGLNQEELARRLNVTQPSISERRNRAHFDAIMAVEALFRQRVTEHLHP